MKYFRDDFQIQNNSAYNLKFRQALANLQKKREQEEQDRLNLNPETVVISDAVRKRFIAKNIIKARNEKKITKVNELVKIIEKSKKKNFSSKINPSTKTFQALRIYVNKEISELINGITKATKILKPGGKLVIVSFHSIEDKIVKYFFSNFSKNRSNPSRYLPEDNNTASFLFEKYNKKVIKPTSREIKINNPSRSAKMRFAIRSENQFLFPQNLFKKFSNYLDIEGVDA